MAGTTFKRFHPLLACALLALCLPAFALAASADKRSGPTAVAEAKAAKSPGLAGPKLTGPELTAPKLTHPKMAPPKLGGSMASSPKLTKPKLTRTKLVKPRLFGPKLSAVDPDLQAIENGKPVQGIKGIGAAQRAGAAPKNLSIPLAPEFRPPVDALTPPDTVDREPKTYERTSPGLSATIRAGDGTEIQGVFSLPGSTSGSARPYGQPELGAKPAPSGGVMLKRTF